MPIVLNAEERTVCLGLAYRYFQYRQLNRALPLLQLLSAEEVVEPHIKILTSLVLSMLGHPAEILSDSEYTGLPPTLKRFVSARLKYALKNQTVSPLKQSPNPRLNALGNATDKRSADLMSQPATQDSKNL